MNTTVSAVNISRNPCMRIYHVVVNMTGKHKCLFLNLVTHINLLCLQPVFFCFFSALWQLTAWAPFPTSTWRAAMLWTLRPSSRERPPCPISTKHSWPPANVSMGELQRHVSSDRYSVTHTEPLFISLNVIILQSCQLPQLLSCFSHSVTLKHRQINHMLLCHLALLNAYLTKSRYLL